MGEEKRKVGELSFSLFSLLLIMKYFVLVSCNDKENLQYVLNGGKGQQVVHDDKTKVSKTFTHTPKGLSHDHIRPGIANQKKKKKKNKKRTDFHKPLKKFLKDG